MGDQRRMNSALGPSPYSTPSHIHDETLGTGEFDPSDRRSSPPMKPLEVKKYAVPDSAPLLKSTPAPISFDRSSTSMNGGQIRSGDAQLLDLMNDGRDGEISRISETHLLPPISDDDCDNGRWYGHPRVTPDPDGRGGAGRHDRGKDDSLIAFAQGALQKASLATADSPTGKPGRMSTADISVSTNRLSIHDGPRPGDGSPEHRSDRLEGRGSLSMQPGSGLPPIMSPNSDTNGQKLPPIRLLGFGDMKRSPSDPDTPARNSHGVSFPHSPPSGHHHLPPLSASHGSPPISPPDSYQRSLPSPNSLPASSPFNSYINAQAQPFTPEYGVTPPAPEASSNEHGGPSQARGPMYINGTYGSSPQPATFRCDFQGCNAPPFQTQYLLNSHANVHSQARPHYCPIAGCSRSEGGKGFKRKNEMIRHGLVHESPGYICPFCPDKDHRYPRPDNLQRYGPCVLPITPFSDNHCRHVRVHHPDKSKDDPQLREVLAQRPDGPSRGRRRRGGV